MHLLLSYFFPRFVRGNSNSLKLFRDQDQVSEHCNESAVQLCKAQLEQSMVKNTIDSYIKVMVRNILMTTIPQADDPAPSWTWWTDTATQTESSEDLVSYLQIARWTATLATSSPAPTPLLLLLLQIGRRPMRHTCSLR